MKAKLLSGLSLGVVGSLLALASAQAGTASTNRPMVGGEPGVIGADDLMTKPAKHHQTARRHREILAERDADPVYGAYGGGYPGFNAAPLEPHPYGPAGGLAVYSPGAYGPGPRIILIPGR